MSNRFHLSFTINPFKKFTMRIFFSFLIVISIVGFSSCEKTIEGDPEIKELMGSWYSDSADFYQINNYSYKPNDTTILKGPIAIRELSFREGYLVNVGGTEYSYYIIGDSVFTHPNEYNTTRDFEFELSDPYLITREVGGIFESGQSTQGFWYKSYLYIAYYTKNE